ncbi:MAG: PorP/SprF family type IX secretion system membrane protein [Bacteroidota bacterium]
MKRLILFLVCISSLSIGQLAAQQLPLYNIYRDHWNVLNPAAISNNFLINEWSQSVGLSYRHQWFGIEDAPRTQVVNYEFVRDDLNSVFGGHLINDRTGKISQTGAYAQYAYRVNFGQRVDQALVVGLNAGLVQYRAKLSQIQFAQQEEQPMMDDNVIYPDFGLGVFYHYSDRYYAGLSVPQTLGLDTRFQAGEDLGEFPVERVQHVYAIVGGYFQVTWFGNETSFVEPSAWVKYVPNAPLQWDINARYQISELVWVGAGTGSGFGDEFSMSLHLESGLILGEQSGFYNGQLKIGTGFDLLLLGGYGADFKSAIEINAIYSFGE